MNRNMAIRRLWWKELRQLVPLIGLLLLVGLLLVLVSLLLDRQLDRRQFALAVLLGMPCLYAAGVGGLLVGQEKELRTIDWLRSLPVPSRDVVRTKLLAAILALVAVWLVSLGLALAVRAFESPYDGSWAPWIWPLYSLYLLLVGFATAWQLRSSLVSLLLVVPLAGLPLLLANLHESVVAWGRFTRDPTPWLMAVYIGLVGVGVMVWGWRAALRYMGPEHSSGATSGRGKETASAAWVVSPRSSPAPTLLWQFYAQNRGLLIGLAVVMLVSSYVLIRFSAHQYAGAHAFISLWGNESSVYLASVAIFVSVSWLGALVFQSDTLQRRSQFLADRGVSPTLTWLTRQGLPWLLLIGTAVFALLVGSDLLAVRRVALLQVAVIGAAIAIFAASQWLGQLLPSVILGAILAPLVSLLFLGYLSYAVGALVASPWIIALTLVVPLVATFGATSAWMDGRTGWRFWTWHGSLLALAALLPSLNYIYLIATYPRMSNASVAELTRLSLQPPAKMTKSTNYSLGLRSGMQEATADDVESSPPAEADVDLAESRRRSIANLREQMDVDSIGLANWDVVKTIASAAILNRLSDPGSTDAERVQSYRESLGLIVDLATRQRRSLRLLDQDLADDYEILLLEEMQAPLAQRRMGDELYSRIADLLTDKVGRDAARRAALASSWWQAHPRRHFGQFGYVPPTELGGYDLMPAGWQRVTPQDLWEASRKVGLVSERLLRLLDATSDAQRDALRTEISALLGFNQLPSIASGVYQQSADGPKLLYAELGVNRIPGRAWHGDWERRAASLRTERETDSGGLGEVTE